MALPLSKYVWFDGKYVPTEKAQVPITTHAIHYGTSIFEGIRAYWNGKQLNVFRLDEHVKRFRKSGQFYNISLNFIDEEITNAIIGIWAFCVRTYFPSNQTYFDKGSFIQKF